ncbi:multidrug resistance protein [Polychaeton citri CBS 116435]|uniref:Multidrug resistance protein n=1 Tax=Polychaeton citri CBS 116435 TaxID=1314669 RepID=A0A9P4QE67_9PEZI|nr:multidrug resistance protein [Polychaeton citri CBS 116435]
MFIFTIPQIQQGLASFERIQAFLDLEETLELPAASAVTTRATESPTTDGVELSIISPKAESSANAAPLISMQRVTVYIGEDKKPILQDCSMQVKRKTLTLVIGPVGCGKSSLLKALIGDLAISRGTIDRTRQSSVGYCSQDPWLPNDTIENLIKGFCSTDETWYSSVVRACGLRHDIDSLPQADETIVGSKGVSLSGGQRARLALARAVYARKDVLVVDDALSGLDTKTSRQVFDGLFGRHGLCKLHGTAVVFATHSVQYLSEADNIVVLAPGGVTAQAGSYDALKSQEGYVWQLKSNLRPESDFGADSQEEVAGDKTAIARRQEDAQQDLARRTGDTGVYRYYLQSMGLKNGLIYAFSCFGFVVFFKLPDLWVRWWSESSVTGHGEHSLATWISVYYVFAASGTFCIFLHIYSMLVWSVPRSSTTLHYKLLKSVMHAPYSFFVKTDSGVTLNRFSQDMSLIEGELAGAFLQTTDGGLLAIASGILIAAGSKYVAAIIPALLVILYLIQKFYLRTSRQLRFMDLEAQAPLLAWFRETSEGASTIRAFGWQDPAYERCLSLLDSSQRPYYLMLSVQRWLSLVLDLTTTAIAVVVVSLAMTLPGASSAGSIGVSMLNILSFNGQLDFVVQAWTTLETSLGAVARCKNFESATQKEDKPDEVMEPATDWPQAGSLEFVAVAAAYEPGGENVLKSVSFSARPGEKIGICGRSGSGKSSTLLALLRMLDNHSGTMTLDGYDLASVPRQLIRERLTALPQEAITVPGSLKENLDPLGRFDGEDIKSALAKVGLLHIAEERGGIEESIDQVALSQGQLQLFSVARALLRKSKVLILDELTSTIDPITEDKIVKLISEEFAGSTIIAVAHRLKTIADFDKVLVMDSGRIVEAGNPQELLQKEGGWFKTLWEQGGH